MKKQFALLTSEREKECPHDHMAWTGSIPCTGRWACTMCGTAFLTHCANCDAPLKADGSKAYELGLCNGCA